MGKVVKRMREERQLREWNVALDHSTLSAGQVSADLKIGEKLSTLSLNSPEVLFHGLLCWANYVAEDFSFNNSTLLATSTK